MYVPLSVTIMYCLMCDYHNVWQAYLVCACVYACMCVCACVCAYKCLWMHSGTSHSLMSKHFLMLEYLLIKVNTQFDHEYLPLILESKLGATPL